MKTMVVGIGGAASNILKKFLETQDVPLPGISLGEPLAFGDIKGIWLESQPSDVHAEDKRYFFGSLTDGKYPGYLISHGMIDPESPLRKSIQYKYGLDLKKDGYDRRAEYLKCIFEVLEDDEFRKIAENEFGKDFNPFASYMWKIGIRPYTNRSIIIGANPDAPVGKATTIGSANNKDKIAYIRDIVTALGLFHVSTNNKGATCSPRNQNNLCDSIFFLASLGGGTGTGFINPITRYIRQEEKTIPIIALGILTEKKMDTKKTPPGQKNLSAIISMYDLLTTSNGINSLILIDNEVLVERYGMDRTKWDNAIYSCMKPLLDQRDYPDAKDQSEIAGIQREFSNASDVDRVTDRNGIEYVPPSILVPCYYHSRSDVSEKSLVDNALSKECRLFPCTPSKADKAIVFTRGKVDADAIANAIKNIMQNGIAELNVKVYKKLGNGSCRDILILLRNPYGCVAGEQNKKEGDKDKTFESRIYGIIKSAIDYIDTNETNILHNRDINYTDYTKKYLRSYFYDSNKLRDELNEACKRIERGDKHFFINPLTIFSKGWGGSGSTTLDPSDRKIREIDVQNIDTLFEEKLKEMLTKSEIKKKIEEIARGRS